MSYQKKNFSDFEEKLAAGGYTNAGGARKALGRLGCTDQKKAKGLKMISEYFGEEEEVEAKPKTAKKRATKKKAAKKTAAKKTKTPTKRTPVDREMVALAEDEEIGHSVGQRFLPVGPPELTDEHRRMVELHTRLGTAQAIEPLLKTCGDNLEILLSAAKDLPGDQQTAFINAANANRETMEHLLSLVEQEIIGPLKAIPRNPVTLPGEEVQAKAGPPKVEELTPDEEGVPIRIEVQGAEPFSEDEEEDYTEEEDDEDLEVEEDDEEEEPHESEVDIAEQLANLERAGASMRPQLRG